MLQLYGARSKHLLRKMSREVAKDGVVRIPKSVFESKPPAPAPAPIAAASSSASAAPRAVTTVVRLDGTTEEVIVGAPPNNPNFAPRQTVWAGKVVTNDKLQVKLKFYERKGLALTPELLAKKAELEAAELAEVAAQAKRAAKFGMATNGNKGGKGKGKGKVPASSGAFARLGATEGAAAEQPAAAAVAAPPKAAPETSAWYKNRPKGGVKVLGGTEGAITGNKRGAEDAPSDAQKAAKM